ncbi:MHYT domain-containing protein [Methylomagnum sp.]
MNQMTAHWNWTLVGLSYFIAVFGSYTALQLAIRIPSAMGVSRWLWLMGAALALGGGAIWSMHFIGMLAYEPSVPVVYLPGLTFLSLLIGVVASGAGLAIVGIGESSWIKLIGAGIVGGLSVAAMHHTGMSSMRMAGAGIGYIPWIVGASLVIAVVATTAALWLAFNLRGGWQRFGSAFVMGAAVCGMHYTGMAAVTMHPTQTPSDPVIGTGLQGFDFGMMIFGIAFVLLAILLIVEQVQARRLREI